MCVLSAYYIRQTRLLLVAFIGRGVQPDCESTRDGVSRTLNGVIRTRQPYLALMATSNMISSATLGIFYKHRKQSLISPGPE